MQHYSAPARLEKLYRVILNLDDHPNVVVCLSAPVLKLDHLDPPLDQCSAPHLITPEADATESAKSCPVSLWNTPDEKVEVLIPRHNDRRQPIAYYRHHRIGASGRKKISNEPHIVAAINEDLSNRNRDVFVDEQQHYGQICR